MSEATGSADAGNPGGGDAASGGEGSNQAPAWTDGLDETLAGLVQTKGWQSPADALTSYRSLESHLGRDPDSLITLPGASATDDDYGAFYGKLGRPEKPDGYGFDSRQAGRDKETDARLAQEAHALGLTPRQATAYRDRAYAAQEAEAKAAQDGNKQAIADTRQALVREWGEAAGRMDKLAGLAAAELGLDGATLIKSGLAGNAEFVRNMARLGEMLAEDSILGGGSGGGGFAKTPAQARTEIDTLMRDQTFLKAYTEREDPGHKGAVAQMQRLQEQANPQ